MNKLIRVCVYTYISKYIQLECNVMYDCVF